MENTDVEAKPEEENRGFEIEQAEEYSEYLLHSKAEIAAVLRSLIQRRALVSAYLDRGHEFLLTSLLEVDTGNDELVLDWGRDEGVKEDSTDALVSW